MERFCGAIGFSLVLLYLATWVIYVLSENSNWMPMATAPFVGISATSVVLGIASRREIIRLFHSLRVQRAAIGYAFLLVWTLAILSMIRIYSGAAWSNDWVEHFQRTLFFLDHFPARTPIFAGYQLAARPPMMNVIAAFFLAQTGDLFELYQVVFTFLNLLLFLSCCFILPGLSGVRRARLLPLLALFALNPAIMENSTYTWTKALAAFFVVLGLGFYISAWRRRDSGRMIAAFIFLAAGFLVHYSAGPYLVFVTAHYFVWLFRRRPAKWRELAFIGTSCSILLATWFGWSLDIYGIKDTLLSNTSVTSSEAYQGNTIEKISENLWDSIAPAVVRNPSLMDAFQQPIIEGRIRDTLFSIYEPNIVFSLGLLGGPVAVWLLLSRLRMAAVTPEFKFWILFIPFCCILGLAVIGERAELGSAHVTLFTMTALGIVLLAGAWSWQRSLARLLLAGCLIDFFGGVFLQADVEHLENAKDNTVFQVQFSGGSLITAARLSKVSWINWFAKHQYAECAALLKELPARYSTDVRFQRDWPQFRQQILNLEDDDRVYWGGWFSRHGGQITYIGDHFASKLRDDVVCAIVFTLLAALVIAVMQQMHKAPEIAGPFGAPADANHRSGSSI
jgi:hypothetical protein